MKLKKLVTALALATVVVFAGCKEDTFIENTGECPVVLSTSPVNGATGVPLEAKITVTFNEKMNPETITQAAFTLVGSSLVSGGLTYNTANNTLTFVPASPLEPNITYTGRVATTVKDLFGNALQSDYVWTFSTGATVSPVVISTDPVNSATGVFLNKKIAATFSFPMDLLTLNATTFTVKQGTTSVAGTITKDGATATFSPTNSLLANTAYTVTITTGAKNEEGTPLQSDYVWSFTTGDHKAPTVSSTDPANLATGVVLNKVISAVFSIAMDPATITTASFTVKAGTVTVPGTMTYSGTTASFTPTANLAPNTTYTATITTAAQSAAGAALANDHVWTFTTIASPTITATDPANLATSVALNKAVSAVFSIPMDAASITTASFTVKAGAVIVPGLISYDGNTATFTPMGNLVANTIYTATVTTAAKSAAGAALASDYVWTFTTIPYPTPTITATDPANSATGVALNKTVTATFSVPMDPASITTASFTLKAGTATVAGAVTYNGNTASFNPTANLVANTVYTATITTVATSATGVALASNHVWTFTTIPFPTPTVTSTDPANSATGVALNKTVTATFSEAMNAASITTASFTVKAGAASVAGVVSYNGNTASFNPTSDLQPNTVYTGTITTAANSAAGVAIASNHVWTFTTAAAVIPPTVTSTDPANLATGVALNKTVTATFSVPMNAASITTASFTVKAGAAAVTGVVSYNGNTASFNPTSDLQANTVYTGTITTAASSAAGTAMASNHNWTFTTAAAVVIPPTVTNTDPSNLETGVALNKTVTATFSVPMNAASITTASFTVKAGAAAVTGVVSYNGNTASFNPTSDLQANTVYTGTITTAASNAAGVAMASNHIWTFTTAAAVIPPTVTSTDPANLATGVALNKTVTASFSVPMDAASISTASFTLKAGAASVAGVVSYNGNTASFNPTSNLESNTVYTATITTAARSAAGVNMVSNHNWTFTTLAVVIPPVIIVDLRSVARFGIFAGTGISNNAGFSEIRNLDVGISPGVRSSVTGFPPAIVVNGAIYASDDLTPPGTPAMLLQAKADLTAAYLFAEGATTPAPSSVSGDQGGKTLAPGIYKTTSTLLIQNGNLTLDAQGDPNAVWIFQIASGFTTIGGAGGSVILTGGAQAKNVFWQTGSSATIGDNTHFKGNILAYTSITMNSGATAVGRMLAINGAVVLTNTNIIEKP